MILINVFFVLGSNCVLKAEIFTVGKLDICLFIMFREPLEHVWLVGIIYVVVWVCIVSACLRNQRPSTSLM